MLMVVAFRLVALVALVALVELLSRPWPSLVVVEIHHANPRRDASTPAPDSATPVRDSD